MTDTVKVLSDDEVAKVEARRARCLDNKNQSKLAEASILISSDIPALCATVRALRAEIADYEQTDLIPRSRYEAADADREEARQQFRDIAKRATVEIERLETENAALREQLAQLSEIRDQFRDKAGELQSQLAQVTQERDELRDKAVKLCKQKVAEWRGDARRAIKNDDENYGHYSSMANAADSLARELEKLT